MSSRWAKGLLAIQLAIGVGAALAAGWGGVLLKGPAEDFNDADVKLFFETARKALDAPADAAPTEWRNEATGAGGSFAQAGATKVKGFDECRRLRVAVYSAKRKGGAQQWTACRDAAGHWKLLSAA